MDYRSARQTNPGDRKIEKPQAVEAIDKITDLTDAVMVARGDLGVEMPAEEVPSIQKMIISLCNRKSHSGDNGNPNARFDDPQSAPDPRRSF
ncbi:MAG: pyruvate kinase [Calditrichia bacterium]